MLNLRAVTTLGGEMKMFNRLCLVLIMFFIAIKAYAQGPVYNFNFNNDSVNAPIQQNSTSSVGESKVEDDAEVEERVATKSSTDSSNKESNFNQSVKKYQSRIMDTNNYYAQISYLGPSKSATSLSSQSRGADVEFSIQGGVAVGVSFKLTDRLYFSPSFAYQVVDYKNEANFDSERSLWISEYMMGLRGSLDYLYNLNGVDVVTLVGLEKLTLDTQGKNALIQEIGFTSLFFGLGPKFRLGKDTFISVLVEHKRTEISVTGPSSQGDDDSLDSDTTFTGTLAFNF